MWRVEEVSAAEWRSNSIKAHDSKPLKQTIEWKPKIISRPNSLEAKAGFYSVIVRRLWTISTPHHLRTDDEWNHILSCREQYNAIELRSFCSKWTKFKTAPYVMSKSHGLMKPERRQRAIKTAAGQVVPQASNFRVTQITVHFHDWLKRGPIRIEVSLTHAHDLGHRASRLRGDMLFY